MIQLPGSKKIGYKGESKEKIVCYTGISFHGVIVASQSLYRQINYHLQSLLQNAL